MGMHAQTQQRLHTADDDKTPGVASHALKTRVGRQTLRPNLNTPLFAGFRPFSLLRRSGGVESITPGLENMPLVDAG